MYACASTVSVNQVNGGFPSLQERLCKLFDLARVPKGDGFMVSHRFRDTFSVELLLAGVPIERVVNPTRAIFCAGHGETLQPLGAVKAGAARGRRAQRVEARSHPGRYKTVTGKCAA
jgi:hypothetical protein